jgi:integrase
MPEKRVNVWVQRFTDRQTLVLQWIDPDSGRRKSRSAGTADPKEADKARADLEYELNHGQYQEASRMSWERFRELFEEEYFPNVRENTRKNYRNCMNLFEQVCRPRQLRSITARTISAFVAGLRQMDVYGRKGMQSSTISVRLQELRGILNWAVSQGFLPKCPPFPEVKVPKKRSKPVPTEVVERLLAKAAQEDRQLHALLLSAWLIGLRIGEALALEWQETDEAPWVDLTRERVWLPAGFVKAVEDQWVPLDPRCDKPFWGCHGTGGRCSGSRRRTGTSYVRTRWPPGSPAWRRGRASS